MHNTCIAIFLLFFPSLVIGSEPFTIISGRGDKSPQQPQACTDKQGIMHLTFGVGDEVYYCPIEAAEKPSPIIALRVPNLSLGMRRGPRIAYAGNAIVITAIGGP